MKSNGQLPPAKETSLRLAYVLYRSGGQLSIHRSVELLGEYFGLSDDMLGPRGASGVPTWTNFVQWARQHLNADGFLEPSKISGHGQWRLSKHGTELGRWAAVFYEERRTDIPPWVMDFMGPARKRIKGFLRGRGSARPSDTELCRWMDLCYRLEMWSEGVDVFHRILKEHVAEDVYRTAARQARICEHHLTEASGDDDNGTRN